MCGRSNEVHDRRRQHRVHDPAPQAGVRRRDVILGVNGRNIDFEIRDGRSVAWLPANASPC